jgi:hypothetical protein
VDCRNAIISGFSSVSPTFYISPLLTQKESRIASGLLTSSCTLAFGFFLQDTTVQTEISNFACENRAIWESNFLLDYLLS